MKTWYCKRCDKEDVGGFHRCFMPGPGQIRALKSKPNPNTDTARKLAQIYEQLTEDKWPGGVTNAKIKRIACEGFEEAWKWNLVTINKDIPPEYGSCCRATDCIKSNAKLSIEYFSFGAVELCIDNILEV